MNGREQLEIMSQEQTLLALEAAGLGSWELDLRTRRLSATDRCKANHGLPPDADLQLDRDFLSSIEDAYRDGFRRAVDDAIANLGAFEIEVPRRWPDGSRHWLLLRGRVVDATRMSGISMDVTERHRVEEALHESEARYRRIVETAQEGIWILDAEGIIEFANERMGALLGCPHDSLVGHRKWDFAFPEDVGSLQGLFARRREGNAGTADVRFRHRDGTEVWTLMSGRPIHTDDGRFCGALDMFTDITARRLAEQRLIESDRRKNEFLTLLGHELRTPIGPILTAARLLELKSLSDPELQKASEVIVRQALHMSKLVDDLLDVGRIAAGKLRLERRVADVNALIAEAVETCTPLIEEKHHTLDVTLPGYPVYVDVDPTRLVQVLCNLLTNAAKYMRAQGRIELSTCQQDSQVAIRVRDDGVGIASEMLQRIFDPFVQIGSSAHRADGGVGLGLSLVKSVVELHGGRVEARSGGTGKGSEFVVHLPTATRRRDSAAV